MSYVSLTGINKYYAKTAVVKSLDLSVERGEFFSLLGPSGCGKTTTLRMLAGFVRPDAGRITIDGRDITGLPPESRDIGIVFQNYAIFPHLSVFDNIAFGLRMRKKAPDAIRVKVAEVLDQVGLAGFENRFERQLSGGQRQRVALARVLVIEPQILLLDEPLSALDKKMREEMKLWIKEIQQAVGITTIYVTHDQGEALTMSDRIAVMKEGEILQTGTPEQIYETPIERFVGEFIGDSNLLDGELTACQDGRCEVDLGDAVVTASVPSQLTPAAAIGDRVVVLVRPEAIRVSTDVNTNGDVVPRSSMDHGQTLLRGVLRSEVYHGAVVRFTVQAGGQTLIVEVPNRPDARQLSVGASVNLHWACDSAMVLR